jgi:enoyl-CoA hydratase
LSAVVTERRGAALWARLSRTKALNSIDRELLAGLHAAMDAATSEGEVRALVITGSGRAFCAGADLEVVAGSDDEDAFVRFLEEVGGTLRRLEQLPLPTIAAVNGLALAGGLELVLCCDLALAADDARIGDAHANYGLLPGGGGTVRLPRRVGPALAKELMFTGAFVPATDLRHSGLFNHVVPAAELEGAVDALVDQIARKSPLGLRRMKQLADDALQRSPDAGLRAELMASALHSRSADMAEGLAAFHDKRDPEFTGR